jgi:hypothetical protein
MKLIANGPGSKGVQEVSASAHPVYHAGLIEVQRIAEIKLSPIRIKIEAVRRL